MSETPRAAIEIIEEQIKDAYTWRAVMRALAILAALEAAGFSIKRLEQVGEAAPTKLASGFWLIEPADGLSRKGYRGVVPVYREIGG